MGPFMEPVIPVTWKNGSVESCTLSGVVRFQNIRWMAVAITDRWVCMQPFGAPVVPEL